MKCLRVFLAILMLCSFAGVSFAAAGDNVASTITVGGTISPTLQLASAIYAVPSNNPNGHIGDTGVNSVTSMSFGQFTYKPDLGYFSPESFFAVQLFPTCCGRKYTITEECNALALGSLDLRDFVTITPVYATADKYTGKDAGGNTVTYGNNGDKPAADKVGVPALSIPGDGTNGIWTGQWMTLRYANDNPTTGFMYQSVSGEEHIVQAWIGFFGADSKALPNNNGQWPLGMTISPTNTNADLGKYLLTSANLGKSGAFKNGVATATVTGSIAFRMTLDE